MLQSVAVSHQSEVPQIFVVVEQQVRFEAPIGARELRSIIYGQAQVDQGRVEADRLALEVGLLFAHGVGRHGLKETGEDPLEQIPRTVVVRVGEE